MHLGWIRFFKQNPDQTIIRPIYVSAGYKWENSMIPNII